VWDVSPCDLPTTSSYDHIMLANHIIGIYFQCLILHLDYIQLRSQEIALQNKNIYKVKMILPTNSKDIVCIKLNKVASKKVSWDTDY
jgi:hypothetical protein